MTSLCHRALGEIEYELDDGWERLRAPEGEAFFLPSSPFGEGAYQEHSLKEAPTRLPLVDRRSGA